MNKFLVPVILSIIILLGITTIYADEDDDNQIPSWIKILVKAWIDDEVTDNEYMTAMSFLIETNIIPMNLTSSSITDEEKRLYELEIASRDNTILILNSTFSDMVSLEIQIEEWKSKYETAESQRVSQSQSDAAAHQMLYDEKDTKYEKLKNDFDKRIEEKSISHDTEISEYTDIIHQRDAEIEDLKRQLNDK